jgi:predicted TIM-barrel fold metal-dependent hydrolase
MSDQTQTVATGWTGASAETAVASAAEIDSELRGLMDVDSHEMIPLQMWEDIFGDVGAELALLVKDRPTQNSFNHPDLHGDFMSITQQSVWEGKGSDAPGALDMTRRPAVMDEMGVARQLVFPGFALFGMLLAYATDEVTQSWAPGMSAQDRLALGRRVAASHNRWAAEATEAAGRDRVRMVGVALAENVDSLLAETKQALDSGIRALWIPGGVPPAGLSPADSALDPFWAMVSEANVPILLHVGTEYAFRRTNAWGANVEQFTPSRNSSAEFPIEPHRGSTLHHPQENFLTCLVLGGVFERHPSLRFGVIECGAYWAGPLGASLDMWGEEFAKRLAGHLSLRPSEYLARNVRVTPFVFEPVDTYIGQYPELSSVFCFSSDFPHREGGAYSKDTFAGRLRTASADVREQFFVTNGELLLPD